MAPDFRYRRLGYVALNVSDIARSTAFYRDFVGLTPAGEALNGERLYRCSERHHDVILHEAAAPGLRRVGWEMESGADVAWSAPICGRWRSRPIRSRRRMNDALGIWDAFRITEPTTGATFEYFHSLRNALRQPFVPSVAKIARLGHVVLIPRITKPPRSSFSSS